jgi:hypothetical protein
MSKLLAAVDNKKSRGFESRRKYVGGSAIGGDCLRAVWYDFRHYPKKPFPPRILRIFERGHSIEAAVVADLKATPGIAVLERDPLTHNQFHVEAFGGHSQGNFDGIIRSDMLPSTDGPYGFKKVQEVGVYKAHPKYYTQMQNYMHRTHDKDYEGIVLNKALFLVECKNTSHRYSEEIAYDPLFAMGVDSDIKSVVEATEPPDRIASTPEWWKCKFCDFHASCWNTADETRDSCRQCKRCVASFTHGKMVCSLGHGEDVCDEFEAP